MWIDVYNVLLRTTAILQHGNRPVTSGVVGKTVLGETVGHDYVLVYIGDACCVWKFCRSCGRRHFSEYSRLTHSRGYVNDSDIPKPVAINEFSLSDFMSLWKLVLSFATLTWHDETQYLHTYSVSKKRRKVFQAQHVNIRKLNIA